MVRLTIYQSGTASSVRCEVEKWEFHDKAMGEQYVMFSISSPVPIPFAVGDWCEFRGQTYTLNVEPSCTQKAGIGTYGAAFTYESVKFNSPQDDLTRCMILDVIPTSGEHSAAYGTNYTGSAVFTLNCFETTFEYQGEIIYYAPVHALLDRIKANLDRLYGDPEDEEHASDWHIYIDDSKCHTDDYIISFNNWTASQALAEVHNTFKLDYTVRGRNILVGDVSDLDLPSDLDGVNGYITDLDGDSPVFFGYGMGYLDASNQGKSLFQIKKMSKNDQQVVTRLRAVGSTRNMPYRYYNNNYPLPQSMFVQNLQLPDTFLDPAGKAAGNGRRREVYEGQLRDVLGDSNDAYIDKNDDAASCPEGIREAVARWDGSDGELPEIYPTIEEAIYQELRANNVPDIDGATGASAYPHYLPYGGDSTKERVDEVLDVGSDCNIGDGIMSEGEAYGMTTISVPVQTTVHTVNLTATRQLFNNAFSITAGQAPGRYILSFTTQVPEVYVNIEPNRYGGYDFLATANVSITVNLYQKPVDGSAESIIGSFTASGTINYGSGSYSSQGSGREYSVTIPDYHDADQHWTPQNLEVTATSTIEARIIVNITNVSTTGRNVDFTAFRFKVGVRGSNHSDNTRPEAQWGPSSAGLYYSSTPFHLMLKDIGVDFTQLSSTDGNEIIISMKSGQCAGREFSVKPGAIEPYTHTSGRKGWKLELDRVNDDSIHVYFPSAANQIKPGDQFVLLNIALPDAYIKAAEVRLLAAATAHLADNCETYYTYQPSVDDIYLQRNIDFHSSDPENSVFWRLYAGMRFPFYGIPKEAGDPLPVADITIDSVTIKMGEKLTPQVDITLNDKLDQSTIQRLQTSVDRLYGSVFSLGGVTYSSSSAVSEAVIKLFGDKLFLSKVNDDTATGNIAFTKGITVDQIADIAQAHFGGKIGTKSFEGGLLGHGWQIDPADNSLTLDNLTVRQTMRIFELLVQQVRATGGEIVVSPANGKISNVVYVPPGTGIEATYTVTIENGEEGTHSFGNMFRAGDWVRCQRWDSSLRTTRSYWAKVLSVNNDGYGNVLTIPAKYFQNSQGTTVAPEVGDELVLLGSEVTSRQGAITITATEDGKPRITIYNGIKGAWDERLGRDCPSLDGCTRVVLGDLSSVDDDTLNPSGYGLYSDNVYLKGKLAFEDGTLISSEISRINSNQFEVRRLKTIPSSSEASVYIHDGLIEVFGSNGFLNISFGVNESGYAVLRYYDNNGNLLYDLGPEGLQYSEASAAGYTSKTYAHSLAGSGATVYLFTAKRQVGIIVADGTYADTKEVAEAADGKWFTVGAQHIQLNGSGEPMNTVTAKTYWNEEVSYNNNVVAKNSSLEDVKQYFRDEYGATEAQISAITWDGAVDEDLGQWKFAEGYDVTITFRSTFYKGNKTDKYNFEQ